jgi:hypothetical protein
VSATWDGSSLHLAGAESTLDRDYRKMESRPQVCLTALLKAPTGYPSSAARKTIPTRRWTFIGSIDCALNPSHTELNTTSLQFFTNGGVIPSPSPGWKKGYLAAQHKIVNM